MYFLSPRRIITALLAAGLAVAMLTPVDVPQSVSSGTDKLVHLVAFGLLVLPAALSRRVPLGLLFVGLFIGAAAFGGAIELIQPQFGRSADVNDWVADMVGAAAGLLLALGIRRIH
ncbi:VanZ family protein [Pseudopelagicola sp. nBUS_19]|uniref:VanZ family protein n=1 Tax=Pseudopelagicola sp. nBUS_19 TaxID=3395316 RepID=UPI003EBDF432